MVISKTNFECTICTACQLCGIVSDAAVSDSCGHALHISDDIDNTKLTEVAFWNVECPAA